MGQKNGEFAKQQKDNKGLHVVIIQVPGTEFLVIVFGLLLGGRRRQEGTNTYCDSGPDKTRLITYRHDPTSI